VLHEDARHVRPADGPFPGQLEHLFRIDGHPHALQPARHLPHALDPAGLLFGQVPLQVFILQVEEEAQQVHLGPFGAGGHLDAREELDAQPGRRRLGDGKGLGVVVVGDGHGRQPGLVGQLDHPLRALRPVGKGRVEVQVSLAVGHGICGRHPGCR